MNHPVEGSRYRWPGDRREFVVVGTGLWYGVPAVCSEFGRHLFRISAVMVEVSIPVPGA